MTAEAELIDVVDVSDEDRSRAHVYGLLSSYLSAPATAAQLEAGADLSGDITDLGQAIDTFAHLCGRTSVDAAASEYHELFIGVGRGELLPYASYYLTGFLNEKPLAKLRNDMRSLGITRDAGSSDPEDHAASVCAMMSGLITGQFGDPLPLEEQRKFYETHVQSWMPYFFRDLEGAKSSILYASVGAVGRVFLEIEGTAFSFTAPD